MLLDNQPQLLALFGGCGFAGLTLFVALEKLAPFGELAAKAMAAFLIAGGALLILT